MSKITVPPAPQPSFGGPSAAGGTSSTTRALPGEASRSAAPRVSAAMAPPGPLNPEFLKSTYRTLLWFGPLLTLCAYTLTQSVLVAASFAMGTALAALLLKSHEVAVLRLIRPKSALAYEGWDARIPLAILVPFKYILVGTALWLLFRYNLIELVAFALGFTTVQVVIFARVLGYMLSRRVRSVGEVYGNQGKAS